VFFQCQFQSSTLVDDSCPRPAVTILVTSRLASASCFVLRTAEY
jgi:hypothetical protein